MLRDAKFISVRTRLIVVFLLIMAFITAAVTMAAYVYLRQYEHEVTDQRASLAAERCSSLVELMGLNKEAQQPDSQEYQKYRSMLRELCRDAGMRYMYAYSCDDEHDRVTYIICVAADDEQDALAARERPYGTVVEQPLSDQERRALAGERVTDAMVLDNEFGFTLAWFDKVEGWDGKVVAGVDYGVDDQRARVFKLAFPIVVFALATIVVLLVAQLALLRRHVFEPLRTIADRMRTFDARHAGEFEPLGIRSHDEMGEIAESFEHMASEIDVRVHDIERMTAERAQERAQLDIARSIQQGLVPERSETALRGYCVAAMSIPAREVGGDFYDLIDLGEGRWAAVVGDASGKGLSGALFMAMTETMIRDALRFGMGPAEALAEVNRSLCAENPAGMFVSALVCVFEEEGGTVRYANAGHLPPIVVRADAASVETIDSGLLLGLFDDEEYEEGTLELGHGEALLLYTDGVTEAVNGERAFLGEQGLISGLEGGEHASGAPALIDAVHAIVRDFVGEAEQFDDLTALAIARA